MQFLFFFCWILQYQPQNSRENFLCFWTKSSNLELCDYTGCDNHSVTPAEIIITVIKSCNITSTVVESWPLPSSVSNIIYLQYLRYITYCRSGVCRSHTCLLFHEVFTRMSTSQHYCVLLLYTLYINMIDFQFFSLPIRKVKVFSL